MADITIIIDTNVIIAASIRYFFTDDVRADDDNLLQHKNYQKAIEFFEWLQRNHEDVTGTLVPTVEEELDRRLLDIVRSTLLDDVRLSPHITTAIWNNIGHLLNITTRKIEKLLRHLDRVDLTENDLDINKDRVVKMSNNLRSIYDNATAAERDNLEQLEKFMDHRNDSDEQILAEAITIKKRQTPPPLLLIASFDTGFFTPRPRDDITNVNRSDEVTREIRERFGIQCDYPHKIQEIVEEHQHRD